MGDFDLGALPAAFDLAYFSGLLLKSFGAGFTAGTMIRVSRQLFERI